MWRFSAQDSRVGERMEIEQAHQADFFFFFFTPVQLLIFAFNEAVHTEGAVQHASMRYFYPSKS